MDKKIILKWTNKYSGDTGFVKAISASGRHFVNTFEENEAKNFKSKNVCDKALIRLEEYGECENNEFEIVNK